MIEALPKIRLDPYLIRNEFPLLSDQASDNLGRSAQPLHYLDNAATSHKPAVVIDAMSDCYRHYYAPVHRGLYPLAEQASDHYEKARENIARFIQAPSPQQLVFTRSATESINMVARGWLQPRLKAGDEVWVTRMEHHANYLPWQAVCHAAGAELKLIELNNDGTLNLDAAEGLYGPKVRMIALSHVSNVLGVINPIEDVIKNAHQQGIKVLVDATQSVGHIPVNVASLACDFFAFSAHKMYGPTGIGALYGSVQCLDEMEPLLLGGGMVDLVADNECVWMPVPEKFEAGSPNLAAAVGFSAAVDYLQQKGIAHLQHSVARLTQYALSLLLAIEWVTVYGPKISEQRVGIIAFNVAGVHPHDIGQIAGEMNVAIRAGHHCCQPLMTSLSVAATARASLAPYNTEADIDALIESIKRAREMFG